MDIFDIIGWAGMILVLVAYISLSANKIKNGILYQIMNLVASVLMAIGLYPKNAWFSFALQVVWGGVAIISIFSLARKQKQSHKRRAKQ
jgi:hypothetical protein